MFGSFPCPRHDDVSPNEKSFQRWSKLENITKTFELMCTYECSTIRAIAYIKRAVNRVNFRVL